MLKVLFKPRTVVIRTSIATKVLLGRLRSEAIVDGNTFQINSSPFDFFYRSSYVVGYVEKSDSGNTINAEIRPTSHVKAGTFLLLLCLSLGLIPLTFQVINRGITLVGFLAAIFGLLALAVIVCLAVRGMFILSASIKEQSIRSLVEG